MKKVKFNTRMLCIIGLMSALVFVGTSLRIKIPIGGTSTMLHMGNVFGVLGGLLFGGLPGGLAAGIGSAIFDLTSEYASEAWITFINKFAMGFAAGFIAEMFAKASAARAEAGLLKRTVSDKFGTVVAAASGSATYIMLYMFKTFVEQKFIMALPWEGVWVVMLTKLGVSVSNGITAVIASVLIAVALRPALKRAHVLPEQILV